MMRLTQGMDQKQSWQACRLGCRLLVCLLACLIAKHSTNKPTKQQIDCDACSFVCLVMMADGLPRVECRQLLKTPGQPFFTRSRKKRRMPQSSASLRRVKNVFPEVADSCVLLYVTYFRVRILDKSTHSVALRAAILVSLVKKHDHVFTEVLMRFAS